MTEASSSRAHSRFLQWADLLVLASSFAATHSAGHSVLAMLGLRCAAVLTALSNEWAHLIAATLAGHTRRVWTRSNLSGHVALRRHASTLLPCTLDRRGDLFVEIPGLSPSAANHVRVMGFWLSTAGTLGAALVGVCLAHATPWASLAWACAAGSCASILASGWTDLCQASHYSASSSRMGCGNLTLLGRLLPGETSALPERVASLLQSMLHVTQLRGAQSGGGAVQVDVGGQPRQILAKRLNAKRADLASRLTRALTSAGRASASGGAFLIQTHVRFATSGPATRDESHPFRFVEAAQRGPRRVFRPDVLEAAATLRPVETAITHNGDLHALTLRGVRIPHPQLGFFLERVLEAENRWTGDSPSLAGALELFLTRGLWLESLRLAYLERIAAPPPDLGSLTAPAAIRSALHEYALPSHALLDQLARIAERVWVSTEVSRRARFGDRSALALRLALALREGPLGSLEEPQLDALAARAVDCFLDNDLLRAARSLEAAAEGTFGCVLTSTLEPNTVVAFVRGQPLSIAVQSDTGTVAFASERNALRVRDAAGDAAFDARLDLELGSAEIARIVTGELLQPELTLYSVAEQRSYTRAELERSGRLVSLRDNPLTPALPVEPESRVRQDLGDIPGILHDIRADYADPESHNRRSAETLAYALLAAPEPRLLLLGITNDLWLAEQFAKNLELAVSGLQVEAVSSNDFLKESRVERLQHGTVVLAVSQSGQDFPTLAALHQIRQKLGEAGHGRLFVLSGEADTLLSQAVGQSFAKRALWLGRVLTNCAGYRPAEAATATVSATHAALGELLLVILENACGTARARLTPAAIDVLCARRDACVDRHAAAILTGAGGSTTTGLIEAQSKRFSGHVLEPMIAFVLTWVVLQANLACGLGLEPSRLLRSLDALDGSILAPLVRVLSAQADVTYYLLLTPLLTWALRVLQRRRLLHRQGVRELLIGDTRYVRQIVWLLARKLFSLSYGFASIKPYAADNQDDLIMTHEPLRGTLALFGIPDGRSPQLQANAAAASMTAQQFAGSRSFGGAGAEVVTIGHAAANTGGSTHVLLPSTTREDCEAPLDLLVEGMFDSWERLLAMQVLVYRLAERIAGFCLAGYDASRTKDQVFAPTTASPVSAAGFGAGRAVKETLRFSRVSLPFAISANPARSTPSLGSTRAGIGVWTRVENVRARSSELSHAAE